MTQLRGGLRARLSAELDHLVAVASPPAAFRPAPRRALRELRRRLPAAEPSDALIRALSEFARISPKVSFVQIGANDGDKGDYLQTYVRSHDWRGLLIEPIPYVFESLASRYGSNSRLTLVNAAIADHDGTATLYYIPRVESAGVPEWYDALATFRRDVLVKHEPWIPGIESMIATIEVPAMTFESACRTYGFDHVDLVQMDTEGYDYEIIKQIDLDRYRPVVLLYEHFHLDAEERRACELHLRSGGYVVASNYMDTMAVRLDEGDRRTRRLAGLLRVLDDGRFSCDADGF